MFEALALYGGMSPWWVAVFLFPCGLAAGSFATVLRHRLPLGRSVLYPSSQCSACGHRLGIPDLVPVLSYVWLRGRCRHCSHAIPARYLLLELTCGLGTAAAGYVGGWAPGFGIIGLYLAGVAFFSRRGRASQAGFSIIEVLVSLALLTAVLLPMLDLGAAVRSETAFHRQMAIMMARSTLEQLAAREYKSVPNPASPTWWDDDATWHSVPPEMVGPYEYQLQYIIRKDPSDTSNPYMRQAVVVVTCNGCPRFGPPVRLTAMLIKLPQTS